MTATNQTTESPIRPLVQFDLSQVLTAEELERFQASAVAAGAASLTEHFLNLTLRNLPERKPAA